MSEQGAAVTWHFSDETISALHYWISKWSNRIRELHAPCVPVAITSIHSTIFLSNSPKIDQHRRDRFKSLGKTLINIPVVQPRIKYLGEAGLSVVLAFDSKWMGQRNKDIAAQFGVRLKQPFVPHITMSYYTKSGYLDAGWIRHLPLRHLTIVEERCVAFDPNIINRLRSGE